MKAFELDPNENATYIPAPGIYRIFADGMVLPEDSNDFQYLQDVVMEKYRIARICK